uniref:Uncharacterized protein n=1 Tax=Siphoviridae sp. ctX581 TaxID=2826365 RepID=A0A8S5MDX2_9CAUD|nr:MAG TPA: hypothetical protein [Siphoviridae sp. ctX581]
MNYKYRNNKIKTDITTRYQSFYHLQLEYD